LTICKESNNMFTYCLSSILFEKLREEKFKKLSELKD